MGLEKNAHNVTHYEVWLEQQAPNADTSWSAFERHIEEQREKEW